MQRRTLVALNETGARIGEHHPRARLTQADVNRLLDLRAAGWSLGQLAKLFRVSKGAVQHVCSGHNWTHKVAQYKVASVDALRQPVALDLVGIAPSLGHKRALQPQSTEANWPRAVPAPLPNLPPLAAGCEPGQRAFELAVWALGRAPALAVAKVRAQTAPGPSSPTGGRVRREDI